jgi:hypothetical protein
MLWFEICAYSLRKPPHHLRLQNRRLCRILSLPHLVATVERFVACPERRPEQRSEPGEGASAEASAEAFIEGTIEGFVG